MTENGVYNADRKMYMISEYIDGQYMFTCYDVGSELLLVAYDAELGNDTSDVEVDFTFAFNGEGNIAVFVSNIVGVSEGVVETNYSVGRFAPSIYNSDMAALPLEQYVGMEDAAEVICETHVQSVDMLLKYLSSATSKYEIDITLSDLGFISYKAS